MLNNHDRLRIWFCPQKHLRRPTKNLLKIEKKYTNRFKTNTKKDTNTKNTNKKNTFIVKHRPERKTDDLTLSSNNTPKIPQVHQKVHKNIQTGSKQKQKKIQTAKTSTKKDTLVLMNTGLLLTMFFTSMVEIH